MSGQEFARLPPDSPAAMRPRGARLQNGPAARLDVLMASPLGLRIVATAEGSSRCLRSPAAVPTTTGHTATDPLPRRERRHASGRRSTADRLTCHARCKRSQRSRLHCPCTTERTRECLNTAERGTPVRLVSLQEVSDPFGFSHGKIVEQFTVGFRQPRRRRVYALPCEPPLDQVAVNFHR